MRRLLIALAGLLVLVAVLIVAAGLTLRTEAGRKLALRVALDRLRGVFAGELRIGRLLGDPLGGDLVLVEATLTDADGRPMIHADRIEGHLDLLALRHGRVVVTGLRVRGATVTMQPLADGELNLARIVRPIPPGPPGPPSQAEVALEVTQLDGRYRWLDGGSTRLDVAVEARAQLTVHGHAVSIAVDDLHSQIHAPLEAQVSGRSTIGIDHDVRFTGTALEMKAEGGALRPFAPAAFARVFDGPITAQVVAEGPLSALRFDVAATPPRGRIEARGLVQASGGGHLELDKAEVMFADATATLHGRLGFDGEAAVVTRLTVPDLTRLDGLGLPVVSGRLALDATARRHEGVLSAQARAHAVRLRARGIALASLDLVADLVDGRASLRLHARDLSSSGHRLASLVLDAHGTSERLRLSALAKGRDGRDAIGLIVEGRPRFGANRPLGLDGQLVQLRLSAGTNTVDSTTPAALHVEVEPALQITLAPVELRSGETRARLTGAYTKGTLSTSLSATHADLAPLWPLVAPEHTSPVASTDLTLSAEANGPPTELRVVATTAGQVRLVDEARPLAVDLRGRRDARGLTADGSLTWGEQHLDLEAAWPSSRTAALALSARGHLELDALLAVHALAPAVARLPAPLRGSAGPLDLELAIGGTRDRPTLDGRIHSERLRLAGLAGDITLGFAYRDAAARAELHGHKLTHAGLRPLELAAHATYTVEQLRLEGSLATQAAQLASWQAELEPAPRLADSRLSGALTLTTLDLGELGALFRGIAGTVKGRLLLSGTLADPSVETELTVAHLAYGPLHLDALSLQGRFADRTARFTLAGRNGDGDVLAIAAQLPIAADAPLVGTLALRRLRLDYTGTEATPLRSLRGSLDGSLKVDGTRAHPRVRGAIAFVDGQLEHNRLPQPVRELRAELKSQDEHRVAISAHGLVGPGEASLDGELHLGDAVGPRLSLKAVLREVMLRARGVNLWIAAQAEAGLRRGKGRWLADLRVRGGNLRVGKLEQARPLQSTDPLADVEIVGAAPPEPRSLPPTTLTVRFDQPLLIHGPELELELDGTLTAELERTGTSLEGQLSSRKGWVALFGQHYDVERGVIALSPGTTGLDLRFSRTIEGTLIGVDVSGDTRNPELDFWSRPPNFESAQVMTMIVSGQNTLSSGDPRDTRLARLAEQPSAAGQASGAISSLIMRRLTTTLLPGVPLDVFRVETLQSAGQSRPTTRFEVGTFLTRKLYLGYFYQTGTERLGTRRVNANTARVEYHFLPSLELTASVGDAGVGWLDLFWTKRY